MKIERTENELIIWETPGCLWIVGLFFAFIGGIFVYGSLGGLADYARQSPWTLAITFFMGSCAIAVGLWLVYQAPITKVVINRITDEVLWTRYGLFGKQETLYVFEEIERFCLVEERDSEDALIWSFGMKLLDGEMLKITSLPSHFEDYERRYVFETNEFMRKQMPPAQMVFEALEESD